MSSSTVLEAASRKLRRYKPIVIVVSGVAGKTTVKEAISQLLRKRMKVASVAGDSPDLLTSALAASNIESDVQAFVDEVSFGDLSLLQRLELLRPDILVVTNILKSSARAEVLLDYVPDDGYLIIDSAYDGPRFVRSGVNKVFFSDSELGNVRASDIEATVVGTRFKLSVVCSGLRSGRVGISTSLYGPQGVLTALAAASAAAACGLTLSEIKAGLETVKYQRGRVSILGGLGGSTLIDDTISFDPISASFALDVLSLVNGKRRIAIFGSAGEDSDFSEEELRVVGKKAAKVGLDHLVVIGTNVNPISDAYSVDSMAFGALPNILRFSTVEEAIKDLPHRLSFGLGDVVLLKGARKDRMGRVVAALLSGKHYGA